MTSSRDGELRLAHAVIERCVGGRYIADEDALSLARALIESEGECQRIRSSASEILTEFNRSMRRLTLMPGETASFDMAVDCMECAIDAALRREEVRDGE